MANNKFSPEIAERILAAIRDGATQRTAARMVGITPESLTNWKRQDPAFGEAVDCAHAQAQVFAENSLYRIATKGNVRALEVWLKNCHRSEWNETEQHENTGPKTFSEWVAAETAKSKTKNNPGGSNQVSDDSSPGMAAPTS